VWRRTRGPSTLGSAIDEPEQFLPDSSAQQWREQREMLVPDHLTAEDNIVRVAMQTWALRSDGRTILIDTGTGNDKSRPALPAWDHLSLGYLENLEAAGVRPEDVDLVINTHLHADHVGWWTAGGRRPSLTPPT
jgi:glyoxylase-like metal-dependent hydrolase (beta-lactamase superfamily II)